MRSRKFDCFMVHVAMGSHPKLADLTDSEFRAHVAGVLAIAAMSPVRGCLIVGQVNAEAGHVAKVAGCSRSAAASALSKLERLGVLERDEDLGCLRVHDWDDLNPQPKADRTNAERQRRFRERRALERGEVLSEACNAQSDAVTRGDVTLKEVNTSTSSSSSVVTSTTNDKGLGNAARKSRGVDQSKPPDAFPAELADSLTASLAILRRVWDVRGGVEPQPRGVALAMLRNVRADHVGVARKLEHWLTAGKGQRTRCGDVAARFGDWLEGEPAAIGSARPAPVRDSSRFDRAAGLA